MGARGRDARRSRWQMPLLRGRLVCARREAMLPRASQAFSRVVPPTAGAASLGCRAVACGRTCAVVAAQCAATSSAVATATPRQAAPLRCLRMVNRCSEHVFMPVLCRAGARFPRCAQYSSERSVIRLYEGLNFLNQLYNQYMTVRVSRTRDGGRWPCRVMGSPCARAAGAQTAPSMPKRISSLLMSHYGPAPAPRLT